MCHNEFNVIYVIVFSIWLIWEHINMFLTSLASRWFPLFFELTSFAEEYLPHMLSFFACKGCYAGNDGRDLADGEYC